MYVRQKLLLNIDIQVYTIKQDDLNDVYNFLILLLYIVIKDKVKNETELICWKWFIGIQVLMSNYSIIPH